MYQSVLYSSIDLSFVGLGVSMHGYLPKQKKLRKLKMERLYIKPLVSCSLCPFRNLNLKHFLIAFFVGLIDLQKAIYNNVDGALAITIGAAAGKEHEAGKPAQKKVAAKPSQKKVAAKPTQENVAAKPAQKKVAATTETVIELSSDIEEVKQEKPFNTKRTGEGSTIKKVQTMTSILTSRSKVIF